MQVGAALAVALALAGSAVAQTAPKPATHRVTIDSTQFTPDVVNAKVGDTVLWINKDMFPHTATSKAAKFDSGSLLTGKSWKFKVTAKGEFPYICTLHPTMKGTIRVK
jgi:plastocyanin